VQLSINPAWEGLGFLLPVREGVLLEVFAGVAVGLVGGRGRPLLMFKVLRSPEIAHVLVAIIFKRLTVHEVVVHSAPGTQYVQFDAVSGRWSS
jgi:hypothetical protein